MSSLALMLTGYALAGAGMACACRHHDRQAFRLLGAAYVLLQLGISIA